MRRRMGRYGMTLLLMGIFSMTQVHLIGSIGVSELFAFFAAPIFLIQDYNELRRHGFLPIVWLSILVMLNCIGSIIYNDVSFDNGLRGFATTYAMFALLVVMHRYLSRDIWSLKWFLLGVAISMIINIFVMQTGTEMHQAGTVDASAEEIMSGTLFLLTRLQPWLRLPTTGWYFSTPLWFSVLALPVMGLINMLTSDSGRSALLMILFSMVLILFGRKNVAAMRAFKKKFFLVVIVMGLFGLALKAGYTYLAEHHILTEGAVKKFEAQTEHGNTVLKVLMKGRMEFFCGLFANVQSPIWGYGPWAIDLNGVYENYLFEYGEADDVERYLRSKQNHIRHYGDYIRRIPAHSMIIGGWTWYGIMAFFFWLYVLYLMYDVLKNHIGTVPEFFGYLALTLPPAFWSVLFSPFGHRMEFMVMIVMMLLVRGVDKGKYALPLQMSHRSKRYM